LILDRDRCLAGVHEIVVGQETWLQVQPEVGEGPVKHCEEGVKGWTVVPDVVADLAIQHDRIDAVRIEQLSKDRDDRLLLMLRGCPLAMRDGA
jgi:hypothetical protein